MQTLILTLHIVVCLSLVILVLLQAGKEGMGVIFGGGSASVFGSGGAGGILSRLTAFMAVLFVITSLSYNYITSTRPAEESTILDVKIEDSAPAPASPAVPESAAPGKPEAAASTPAAPEASTAPAPAQQPAADAPAFAAPAAPAPAPQSPAAANPGAKGKTPVSKNATSPAKK